MTKALEEAIDKEVPKIRTRTLPQREIDEKTKGLMKEAERLKTLLLLNIDYLIKKRRLNALREIIRGRWSSRNAEMWSKLVEKIDLERDKKEFWRGVIRMLRKGSKRDETER